MKILQTNIQADWEQTDSSAPDFIKNKPSDIGGGGGVDTSTLAKVATTGSYNDLINKPTIPTVPTKVSAFTNDAGYLVEDDLPEIPIVPTKVSAFENDKGYLVESDLPDIPTIPTKVSAFTNDAGYLTDAIFPIAIENGGTNAQTANDALLNLSDSCISVTEDGGVKSVNVAADAILMASQMVGILMEQNIDLIGEVYQNGTIAKLQPALLWTNASPGSDFAGQTVTLSDTSYTIIAVRCCWGTTDNGAGPVTVCVKGLGESGAYYGEGNHLARRIKYNEDGTVTFSYCLVSGSTNNSRGIPTHIWGIC